jgi:hypothetical protein
MLLGTRSSSRSERIRAAARLGAAVILLFIGVIAVRPNSASAAPLQRGDILTDTSTGLQEYTPGGQLVQTIPGAAVACIDPDGKYLIAPGVGLFDSSGNPVPSKWSSVSAGRCVADGSGNVYVAPVSAPYSVVKYHITGKAVQSFGPFFTAGDGLAFDLAPDQCTLYYATWGIPAFGIGRFNVCTNTQGSQFSSWPWNDDVRVLPNWQLITLDDRSASLLDTSGDKIEDYVPSPSTGAGELRTMALDPDATSFWACCNPITTDVSNSGAFRFDIGSGRQLSTFAGAVSAVYGPPLLGEANVARTADSNRSGTAEAFSTAVGYTGQMTRLHLYVDSSTTASSVVVGVYSDRNGHPGSLQEQATITNLRTGSWDYADVPTMPVTAGQRYWMAVLGPKGGGTIRFRDAGTSGGRSETSPQRNLTALPPKWSAAGTGWGSAPLSAYGS